MSEALIYSGLEDYFNELLLNPGELFLISPFTNADAIRKLLTESSMPEQVTLVTRWRLEDITSGVSDIEVYRLLQKFNGKLFINHRLHAKYYRKGNKALVGSANLTHNGFSIGKKGNLELLTLINASDSECFSFEAEILRDSILVDELLYNKMSSLQKEISSSMMSINNFSEEVVDSNLPKFWWPESRNPEMLWENYLRNENLIAQRDLHYLSLPIAIPNEEVFKKLTMAAIELHPNIQKVVRFIGVSERRFGEMRQYLREIDSDLVDSTLAWQTLFRWLLYLDPERFEYFRPNFTEIIRLRK
jgi:hypothetical protein